MKKIAAALLGLALSAAAFMPGQSLANDQPFVIHGKFVQERTLVPVRYVTAGLGADVSWNQQTGTVTILKGDTKVQLQINSSKVIVGGKEIIIDVPAQADQGVTYVPFRFISQALEGTIAWNPSNRTVGVSLGDKQVTITTESTFNHSKIPQSMINTLVKKVNEAAELASYSQIRAHFKPYFTDVFINTIIQQKGLKINVPFNDTAYTYSDDKNGTISQSGYPIEIAGNGVERLITVKRRIPETPCCSPRSTSSSSTKGRYLPKVCRANL